MSTSSEPSEPSKRQDAPKRERAEVDQWYRATPDAEEGPRPIFDELVRPPRRTAPKSKLPPGEESR